MTRKSFETPDGELWDDVKRSVKPLSRRQNKNLTPSRHAKPTAVKNISPLNATTMPVAKSKRRSASVPPPLAQLDRRTAQRLGRGQIDPEARVDLHGEGLETARIKLLHFLATQRHAGLRFVLVITGKGASPFARHTLHGTAHFHAPEREGRLRREVPLWLNEDQFRLHAVAFQPAHPRHGGGGAFYVRLRKSGHHE